MPQAQLPLPFTLLLILWPFLLPAGEWLRACTRRDPARVYKRHAADNDSLLATAS